MVMTKCAGGLGSKNFQYTMGRDWWARCRLSLHTKATGQQEFDTLKVAEIGHFHSLVTWLGQSPFNSAQSVT
jgi:hypothetical protein